jgi:hypothetical protein
MHLKMSSDDPPTVAAVVYFISSPETIAFLRDLP